MRSSIGCGKLFGTTCTGLPLIGIDHKGFMRSRENPPTKKGTQEMTILVSFGVKFVGLWREEQMQIDAKLLK